MERSCSLKIIDIHAHTSNHLMRDLHTKTATIEFLEAEAWRCGIGIIVLMATYFPLKGTGVCNIDLLERVKGKSLFKIFGSLDVMNDFNRGCNQLYYLALNGLISGIKLYPGYQGFEPSERRLFPVYRLAETFNLPVMFHGGELHHCCRVSNCINGFYPCGFNYCRLEDFQHLSRPEYIREIAGIFPCVKFVVSHLANPYFDELRRVMEICPNVFTDISGQFVSGSPENTEEYRLKIISEIKKFLFLPNGLKRIMFATDFPIQSYDDSFDLVRRLNLNKEEEEYVFYRNAEFVLNKNSKLKENVE